MNKKVSLLLLITAIAITIGTTGCTRKKVPTVEAVEAVPVKVIPVETGDIKEVFKTTGTIEAAEQATVSAKVAGRVTAVRGQLGDYVSKGQVLVSLEKIDLSNQLNQSKVALAQAEVNYKQSKDNFDRKQKLFTEQIISQQEYDNAKTQLELAENQLNQARIGIDMIQEQIRNTEIRAPISGYIGSRRVNEGEMVSPGAPLFSIVDLSQVYVTINLSDSYIAQTKLKQPAEVSLVNTPGKIFKGNIVQIAPAADAASKTYPVKILLNNSARIFKDGMLTEVTLNFNEKNNVLKIPIDSVIDEIGSKSVYVIENDLAKYQKIELGISDGKSVEVISGLTGNEQVVVLGQNNLEDGAKVVVK